MELYSYINKRFDNQYKISFITELKLLFNGKRDAKNGCIAQIEKNFYTSPYIQKEINLCLAAFEEEKMQFYKQIKKHCVLRKDYEAKMLKADLVKKNDVTIYDYNYKNFLENIFNNDSVNSQNSFIENLEKTGKWSRFHSHNTYKKNIEQYKINTQNEISKIEINSQELYFETFFRCKIIYQIFLAKAAIYWKGVLRSKKDYSALVPSFLDESILIKLSNELKQIFDDYTGESEIEEK